jgi:integrase
MLSSFKTNELRSYIRDLKTTTGKDAGRDASDCTKANLYRYIALLFNFGVARKHLPETPVSFKNEWAQGTKTKPGILSYLQSRRLVEEAWKDYERRKNPQILAYVIFGLFCGVRREELLRLKLSCIKPDRTLEVDLVVSKTRSFRKIPIPLNAWIIWEDVPQVRPRAPTFAEKNQPFFNPVAPDDNRPLVNPRNFRKNFDAVRAATGVIPVWPKNAQRHTFASYFYSSTNDRDELMKRLGHTTDAVTFDHYMSRVREALPIGFFRIEATKEQHERLFEADQALAPFVNNPAEMKAKTLQLYRLRT